MSDYPDKIWLHQTMNGWLAVDFKPSERMGLPEYVPSARIRELENQLADWQASQHYSYIGRDGKRWLACDLEARADRAQAQVAAMIARIMELEIKLSTMDAKLSVAEQALAKLEPHLVVLSVTLEQAGQIGPSRILGELWNDVRRAQSSICATKETTT